MPHKIKQLLWSMYLQYTKCSYRLVAMHKVQVAISSQLASYKYWEIKLLRDHTQTELIILTFARFHISLYHCVSKVYVASQPARLAIELRKYISKHYATIAIINKSSQLAAIQIVTSSTSLADFSLMLVQENGLVKCLVILDSCCIKHRSALTV